MRGVIAIALLLIAAPAAAQERPGEPTLAPAIVTVGTGTVRRPPDLARVTVAVETRAGRPRDAQQQNATIVAAITSALQAAGIARESLRTAGIRLQQEFDTPNGRRTPAGFLAENAIEIELADVGRAGAVVDAALAAGATRLDGVVFDLRERAAAEREALRLAVADARARADVVAAAAGRTVDRVVRVEEAGEAGRPQAFAPMARVAAPTTVEPGLIAVGASVQMTVSIK